MQFDQDIVQATQQDGHARQKAITALYNEYAPQFKRFFRRNRVPDSAIEDVTQITFVNVVRGIDNFRGDCPLKNWLWTVARNTMLSHGVKKPQEIQTPEDMDMADFAADQSKIEAETLEDCVDQAFECFSNDHNERAEVLRLASIEGWSTQELSEFIGRTLGATREFVSQCKKKFAEYLVPCKEYIE